MQGKGMILNILNIYCEREHSTIKIKYYLLSLTREMNPKKYTGFLEEFETINWKDIDFKD